MQPAESLTNQTADLLRLLAVHVGEPVAVETLLEALWPKVDERRGRASLRTAASRLRKALGEDCVQRQPDGLVLTGVWVDAHEFRALAHRARRHTMAGERADAVATARAAEALYVDEFRSNRDGAEWSLRERDSLSMTYRTMIADAAEDAAALGWWHEAVDLAERILDVEPSSERGFRTLMRGQHGLGETSLALKTYGKCRQLLAEDLGTEPSGATQALYLELLVDGQFDAPALPILSPDRGPDRLLDLAQEGTPTHERTLLGLRNYGRLEARQLAAANSAAGLASPAPTTSLAPTSPAPASLSSRSPALASLGRASASASVLIDPGGELRSLRSRAAEVRALTLDPGTLPEELLVDALAATLLGRATAIEVTLAGAAAQFARAESTPDLAVLRCLLAHDLGRPEFPARYSAAAELGAFDDPYTYQWVAIRMATERNDLGAAVRADLAPTPASAHPLVRQLRSCASAALAVERCRPDDARASLLEVLDVARESGSTFAVPEALARLILLDAYTDLASARQRFEQFEESIGDDAWLPRENVLRMIARSAMRAADGRPDDAASAAAAAADVAERAGLVLLAAQAHRHRAVQLAAAGKRSEARLAVAAAARWQRSTLALPTSTWPGGPGVVVGSAPAPDRGETDEEDPDTDLAS